MAKFTLKELPYDYEALSPHISDATLKLHHDKHHQAYCDKFNAALEAAGVDSEDFSEIFENVSDKPAIRNNGGGFWNHQFYWESMCAASESGTPSGGLAAAIDSAFGSFDGFKEQFSTSAASVFGSGWTWLGVKENGELEIYNTPNQDNFMMDVCEHKSKPILVIDVWEHAYYVDYKNVRPDYIKEFFSIINWNKVEERYSEILNN